MVCGTADSAWRSLDEVASEFDDVLALRKGEVVVALFKCLRRLADIVGQRVYVLVQVVDVKAQLRDLLILLVDEVVTGGDVAP